MAVIQPETQAQHSLLPVGQCGKHLHKLLLKDAECCRLIRHRNMVIPDKIAQMTVVLLAHRCLHGYRLLRDLQNFPNFIRRHIQALSDLLRFWFTAKFLQKLA